MARQQRAPYVDYRQASWLIQRLMNILQPLPVFHQVRRGMIWVNEMALLGFVGP